MSESGNDLSEPLGTNPSDDSMNDDMESYHGYSVDDETQPQSTGDSLVDDDRGLADPLDEGFSPGESYSAGQGFGNTHLEESMGETLDQRVAQEIPEPDPYEQAEREAELASSDENAEVTEVGDERAGRLVEPDEGVHTDVEGDLLAQDVGIDGAAAGAEEAAVHVVPE
ncbi:DUF5709 domain-containing protein [uncultured Nocardioides sp.]|uniref:DUF5709 domain-containing protein n=1 Tax=uncultured Nocardioides sp. TaxID=198441 RepID=UPI0025D41D26|nr:DUF5709 domain-containing protein [uncultured Nocardioides sp.]